MEITSVNLLENVFISWQGEGPDTGFRMAILRFPKCNKACEWCDTALRMRINMPSQYSIDSIQNKINAEKCGIMITGGEPTFKNQYDEALALLTKLEYPLANIESNGYRLLSLINDVQTLKPNANIKYMYSPKIFNGHDNDTFESDFEKLKEIPNVYFKIVYESDNMYLPRIFKMLEKYNMSNRTYIMIKGVTKEELFNNASEVFDICEDYKFNISSREHIVYNFI